jgi:acylphosphatase
MKAVHLFITGHVQGVGFRDWLFGEAQRLGISGWVRNIGQDQVEATLAGESDAVEECLRACPLGPPLASVYGITQSSAEVPTEQGFVKRPSLPAL